MKGLNYVNKNAILTQVLDKLITQTNKGVEKYGETVNPDDYSTVEWIDHLQEELIDALVYSMVIRHKVVEGKK